MRARSALAVVPPALPVSHQELAGMVRVLNCGSVDDGKSTLIGRLLWDASDLFDDQREALRSGRRVLNGEHLDYSLLVDGLIAEREQGITIDIAWRAFDTADRRFMIIDSPGHEQYTRNMASGASHADIAIMLIDARHGIKRQTRRHAALLDLFGVRRVVLAVNKMDLVNWSQADFRAIETDFKELLQKFRFEDATTIPVSAVLGDNISNKSNHMDWYHGPTLLERLSAATSPVSLAKRPLRMPVQTILRDGQDFRGLAGTITSGRVAVGDNVTDAVSGQSARVVRIATMDGDLASARENQAVALVLDRDIDISRGAVLSAPHARATAARTIEARLVWLSEQAFDPQGRYLLRTASDLVPISRIAIASLLDLETFERTPAQSCSVNDICVADIDLGRPTALDTFAASPSTGNIILVDAISGATVAGGTVMAAHASMRAALLDSEDRVFKLTREALARGLCADLNDGKSSEAEFRRRAHEVALLMRAAGVPVTIEV